MRGFVMGVRAVLLLVVLGSFGCGQTATVEAVEGRTNAYEIECVQPASCAAKAREVCGERFQVVSRWERPIALPDVRPSTWDYPPHYARPLAGWEGASTVTGPAEATPPPVRGLDVVCVN